VNTHNTGNLLESGKGMHITAAIHNPPSQHEYVGTQHISCTLETPYTQWSTQCIYTQTGLSKKYSMT